MRRVALLLGLIVFAAGAGASHATTSATMSLTLATSSRYAVASGTAITVSANALSFTVTASGGTAPYTFPAVSGFATTVSTDKTTATYTGTATTGSAGTYEVKDTTTPTPNAASFKVELDAPTVTNLAPTVVSGAGKQYWAAGTGTLWYQPAASGSFTLNASPSDSQTGIAKVDFPDVSATSGWAGSTGGTATSSPYASPVTYAWTAGASAPGAKQVTATSDLGGTASVTVTINADSTPPTGQTAALGGGPWYTAASVPLTLGDGTDAGSGVDAGQGTVLRASAPLTNGVCGTYGSYAAVTLTSGADTTVSSGTCYRYEYEAVDNVGNLSGPSAPSADAKVDLTPPTAPVLVFSGLENAASSGNVVFYRPGGSGAFTVTVAATDPDSGIATYAFPSISGFTAYGSGPSRTYTSSDTSGAPSGPLTVSAANAAGLASSSSFTLVADTTPPTLTVLCDGGLCRAAPYAKAVRITASAADGAGSGVQTIRYTTDGTMPTPTHGVEYTRSFTVGSLVHLRMRAFDRAGNGSRVVTLTIRSTAERLAFVAPLHLQVRSGSDSLVARVRASRRAIASATLSGPGLKKPRLWRFVLDPGTTLVRIRLPAGLSRPGRYRLVWRLRTDNQTVSRTTVVALAAARKAPAHPAAAKKAPKKKR